jgi:superfamily II DNA or RNA helicase
MMEENRDVADQPIEPGTRVRRIADPGRTGVTTGRVREYGGKIRIQVQFADGTEFVSADQLEEVLADEDPLDLVAAGRFGRAQHLRQTLTYHRLTGRLANVIYSMQTTNTDFYAHQFKPVLKLLNSPSNGLLIADEVGLGKTIEAGLIWTELRARADARRLLVVCPAMLREKWQEELRNRFGVEAAITDAVGLHRELKDATNGSSKGYALIVSMPGVRPFRGWDVEEDPRKLPAKSRLSCYLRDAAYDVDLIDLLIIDEAHYLRNPETLTNRVGTLLRQVASHVVLLSATPIHLQNRDLFQLLHLVDEDSFAYQEDFDAIIEANQPLVEARDIVLGRNPDHGRIADLLRSAQTHELLRGNRQLQALLDNPPSQETLADLGERTSIAGKLESANLWSHVYTRSRKRDVEERRVIRVPKKEAVPLTDLEREFYDRVTEIVRAYAEQSEIPTGFLYVTPQRQMASSMPAALQGWLSRRAPAAEELAEDLGESVESHTGGGDVPPLIGELVSRLGGDFNVASLRSEDTKYERLFSVLSDFLRSAEEKVVLFAYFRPTLRYLHERLSEDGISSIVLMGGGGIDRQEVLRSFASKGGPRVLLSSEVGSEGIDLQFCHVLINYDLPWNPMRIEQRIGRLDRLGQESARITIWNLFAADTIDERIHDRLFMRLGLFKTALGDMEAVLGEEFQRLTVDLLTKRLSDQESLEQIDQTAQALVGRRQEEQQLEDDASGLIAHGDYILNEVAAARELKRRISEHDLDFYVRDFLDGHYPGCRWIPRTENEGYEVSLSPSARQELEKFVSSENLWGQTDLTRPGVRGTLCRFENRTSSARRGHAESISQFHPLVRWVSRELTAGDGAAHGVAAAIVRQLDVEGVGPAVYAFCVDRWEVRAVRDVEQLHFEARSLQSGERLSDRCAEQLVVTASRVGTDWATAAQEVDLSALREAIEGCLTKAEIEHESFVRRMDDENLDRADVQLQSLDRHLEGQLSKLENIRGGHEMAGRRSLARATEGRMAALRGRVESRRQRIESGRRIVPLRSEIAVGVIRVEEAEA